MLRKELTLLVGILGGSMTFAQNIVRQPINPNGVTPVHTALDHISILLFPEKITLVAAGSDAMQVEWHENSVFIKPLKAGQSTNLMVWTEHQMSTYELERLAMSKTCRPSSTRPQQFSHRRRNRKAQRAMQSQQRSSAS